MKDPSKIAEGNPDAVICTIPGSTFHNDDNRVKEYYYLFKSGKATPFSKLESDDYCKKEARAMCDFLEQHTPAGIFKEYILEMSRRDSTCNNYLKEIL